jgi:hypothetical protein
MQTHSHLTYDLQLDSPAMRKTVTESNYGSPPICHVQAMGHPSRTGC